MSLIPRRYRPILDILSDFESENVRKDATSDSISDAYLKAAARLLAREDEAVAAALKAAKQPIGSEDQRE